MATKANAVTQTVPREEGNVIDDTNYQQSKKRHGLLSFLTGKPSQNIHSLTEISDPRTDLERFKQDGIKVLKAQESYNNKWWLPNTRFVHHSRELPVSIVDSQTKVFLLYEGEEFQKIQRKFGYFHHGLVIIGIKSMHIKGLGRRALVSIMDDRDGEAPDKIIALAEVDLNPGIGIVYCAPDIMTMISEGVRSFQIGVQVKGYQKWKPGAHNLQFTVFVMGRGSNRAQFSYKIENDKIVNTLCSAGVTMLTPAKVPSETNAGQRWLLEDFNRPTNDEEDLIL